MKITKQRIKMNIVSSDSFIQMLDEGIKEDAENNIDFNDEIVSITPIGLRDTMDINVKGKDHFFYANNILTHNSVTGNNLDIQGVGNESVSDSIGAAMTADFMLFLLQTAQMKEEGLMTCKVTKNRFTGRTDFWDMNIDYEHMRFSDVVVQPGDMNISSPIGMTESQIKTQLNNIAQNDIKIIKKHDSTQKLEDDFDVLNELGLS